MMTSIGMMTVIAKGSAVTVRSENGAGINCPVVDSDANSVWVRLPTNTVIKLTRQTRGNLLVGRVGTLEITLDLNEN